MTQPVDRLQDNLERVLELLLPRVMGQLALYVSWEYRVAVVESSTPPIVVSCVPVDVQRCPFGPLRVPVWKGPSGSPSVPVIGSLVAIGFHDGNPAKPVIVGMDPSVPTLPPSAAPVPGLPLSVAGALTTFATGLNVGTLPAQALVLVADLVPLL